MSEGRDYSEPGRIGRWLVAVPALIIVCLIVLLPILWATASALRPSDETFSSFQDLGIDVLIPSEVSLDNFARVLHGPFGRSLFNSLFVTGMTVALGLVVCSLAAFAFSFLSLGRAGWLFGLVVVAFMIPDESLALPLARIVYAVGMGNTYQALILPGLANGLAIFVLRQFFLGLPPSLIEAARVDGASWFRVYASIVIPLSRPALLSTAILLFVSQWQAYLWPLLATTKGEMHVASIALAQLFGEFSNDYGAIFAGALILGTIPALILLPAQGALARATTASGINE